MIPPLNTLKTSSLVACLMAVIFALSPVTAHAVNLMLDGLDVPAANDSGTANGIFFNTVFSAGGVSSFLELDLSGSEVADNAEGGHNSSAAILGNDEFSASGIMLSQLPVVLHNSEPHFQILLDANEPGGTRGVRITKLQFYSSPTDGLTYTDGDPPTSPADAGSTALGTLAKRLDTGTMDNTVTMLNDGTGLNAPDLEILVPVSVFAGRNSSDFLYLYAEVRDVGGGREIFGVDGSATGFLAGGIIIVPEPSGALLALAALGLGLRRRRNY